MIGELGGEEQQGNGYDRFEVDATYNLRYIGTGSGQQHDYLQGEDL